MTPVAMFIFKISFANSGGTYIKPLPPSTGSPYWLTPTTGEVNCVVKAPPKYLPPWSCMAARLLIRILDNHCTVVSGILSLKRLYS